MKCNVGSRGGDRYGQEPQEGCSVHRRSDRSDGPQPRSDTPRSSLLLPGWKRGVMKKFAFGAVVGGVVVYIAMAATVTELMDKIEAMGKQK